MYIFIPNGLIKNILYVSNYVSVKKFVQKKRTKWDN